MCARIIQNTLPQPAGAKRPMTPHKHLNRAIREMISDELEFGDVGYCGGWKIGEPGQKPSE